ncbi:MAG TPA: nucleoside hydrolase [Candidatus Sulfotelmatobacter sp.]|nr:nucleoside hydrolase [Candidatus Sulfotelmatobacter sp.]
MTESRKNFHSPVLSIHCLLLTLLLFSSVLCRSEEARRKIIIDQDGAGPAGTDQQAMLLLIQSPQTEVLGITVMTGDAWLKAEVAHTLRMLEIIGRSDIPVVAGAEYPLVRRQDETELWERQYGLVPWVGAWTPRMYHPPDQLGEMPEGTPKTRAADEDAAHFLVRMVRKYPHEITIYEGGPMTNLALAIAIDPAFPTLAKELIFMGGSFSPRTDDPEFRNTPTREFNLWFDPEAAHRVLLAPWPRIVCTSVDISVKTRLTQKLIDEVKAAKVPAATYVARYARLQGEYNYLWDELAALAWIDPSLITSRSKRYMDADLDRGAGYGNTLSWTEADKPTVHGPPVEIQDDLDTQKFYQEFIGLLTAPTPKP